MSRRFNSEERGASFSEERGASFSEERGVRSEELFALLFILCTLLIGCTSSDDTADSRNAIKMPVVITLPAEQFADPHDFEATAGGDATKAASPATRADDKPGDPGKYERFELPTWLYAYAVVTCKDGSVKVSSLKQQLSTSSWAKTAVNNTVTANGTRVDSVYKYSGSVNFDIDEQRQSIKVYVAVWDRVLNLSNPSPQTEGDVLAITATFSDKDMASLGNLYSTPYNLTVDANGAYSASSTYYYGTLADATSAQPYIDNLMLYHVAAKLDLKWNVSEDVQSSVSVPYIGVTNLKNSSAYLFKPMDNVGLGDTSTSLGGATTPGNKWLGRKSFYVIPYRSSSSSSDTTFPVTLKLREADTEKGISEYKCDIPNINAFSGDNVFTPWIRGNISVIGSY